MINVQGRSLGDSGEPDRFQRAFTRVELLVGPLVIGILASLLLPVLSRARSAADRAL